MPFRASQCLNENVVEERGRGAGWRHAAVRAALVAIVTALSSCHSPTDATPAVSAVPDNNPPAEAIVPSTRCATTLGKFGGLQWQARTQALSGPGPNVWNACQAWLDTDGLHLRLDKVNGVWTSAEVFTTTPVAYGRLEFEVATPLQSLDPNVVFGFFTYPTGGVDGQHEIDIEFARFGATAASATNLNYVVYPTAAGQSKGQCSTHWDSPQAPSTHRFLWSPGVVEFQSFAGVGLNSAAVPYRAWRYAPSNAAAVSAGSWPLYVNLWSYLGKAPTNGLPVEIVISRITYSTAATLTATPSATCP